MKAKLFIFSILFLCAAVMISAGRVRPRAIATSIDYLMSAGTNQNGTNILIGYLSPNSIVSSIDVVTATAFDTTTSNNLTVFSIITNKTNNYVVDFDLAAKNTIYVPMTNVGSFDSTSVSVPVYLRMDLIGSVTNAAGASKVVINYVQF